MSRWLPMRRLSSTSGRTATQFASGTTTLFDWQSLGSAHSLRKGDANDLECFLGGGIGLALDCVVGVAIWVDWMNLVIHGSALFAVATTPFRRWYGPRAGGDLWPTSSPNPVLEPR